MAEQYGAYSGGGYFSRRTIIIDKAGKVRYAKDGMPNHNDLLKFIAELK
jgi:peroxiredoxin